MPHATRRALLATAPALITGDAAAAPAELSEFAAAAAKYIPFLCRNAPRESDFLFPGVELADDEQPGIEDIDYSALEAAQDAWVQGQDTALQPLIEAQARSLEELTLKLQIAADRIIPDFGPSDEDLDLLSSCIDDLKAIQAG